MDWNYLVSSYLTVHNDLRTSTQKLQSKNLIGSWWSYNNFNKNFKLIFSEKVKKELYVKDYAKRCLKAFPYQVTTLLMYGVIRKNKYYCTFKRGKKDIVNMAKCLNAIKPQGTRCMNKLIDEAMVTINAPEKMKIGLICW